MSEPSAIKSGLTLAGIAAACTALVALTYTLTEERIRANERAHLEASLRPALSGIFYDGDLTESKVVLPPPHPLPGKKAAVIYRVYNEGEPVAALFVVTARNGYAGPIRLLLGVETSGRVSGVRILEHQETPGLGDGIEKSKSDWVQQFEGRSLGSPPVEDWRIRRDGGDFDQLTGASITPRAVIQAIRETLIYFEANRDAVFAMRKTGEQTDE